MSKRDMLELAVRIIGLWLVCKIVIYLPYFLSLTLLTPPEFMNAHNQQLAKILSIIYAAASLSFGLILFFFGPKISNMFYKGDENIPQITLFGNKQDLFKFSLKIIGVYLIITNILSTIDSSQPLIRAGNFVPILLLHILHPLIGLVFGIYLLIDGKIIVNMAYRSNESDLAKPLN